MTHRTRMSTVVSAAMLAMSVAATAEGQAAKQLLAPSATAPPAATALPADTAAPATAAAAPLPKWINEIAVDAFVSTGYLYNFNRPATGANSYRVFDFVHN